MTISPQLPPQSLTDRGSADLSAVGMGSQTLPSVSVVIAAWTEDRWVHTVEAVNSALHQSLPPLEVILVVDHNLRLAQRARGEWDDVTVVENIGSKGASGARNTGVMKSRGEVVAFLDDDAVATSKWLVALCRHFTDTRVLGVGGGLELAWPGPRPPWFPREFDWAVGGSYTGMPEQAAPIRNVWAGNMAIRRTAFDAVEGFRPGFGKTGRVSEPEDTDLCLRVRQAVPSGHWMYDPAAEVVHKVPAERSTPNFFLKRCWNEGVGKAALARLTGINASTVSERRHATRVLPLAFFRELYLAVRHREFASLQRSAAIAVGLLLTAAGLLTEMFKGIGRSTSAKKDQGPAPSPHGPAGDDTPSFRPINVFDWDVLKKARDTRSDELVDSSGGPVHLLVRMGTEPLGYTDFEVDNTDSIQDAAGLSAWLSFRTEINARLVESGLPSIADMPTSGLDLDPRQLAFVAERERVLDHAPDISVVVCTRDRPQRLAACIKQLALQHYPSREIVVVDNAPSQPGAVQAELESLEMPVPVRYVLEPRGGLSWARNAGWRSARTDIIAFLDDDEIADPYWLAELARGFSAAPNVGCVSGMILPAELKTEAQEWFEQFGGHSKGRGFIQEIFEPGHPQSPLYPLPPFGAGGNMAFRRDVLIDIDGFHVALGGGTPTMGGEDSFAFTRALLGEHTLVYQPTALVRHNHYDTVAGLTRQLQGYGTGLTAFYAALLAYKPTLLVPLLRLVPCAIKDMRGKDSVRTASMRDFPMSALQAHRKGMLHGVASFVRSVREQRRKGHPGDIQPRLGG